MKKYKINHFCVFLLLSCGCFGIQSCGHLQIAQTDKVNTPTDSVQKYFTNPIRAVGADPWVINDSGNYYFSESDGGNKIFIGDFKRLADLQTVQSRLVYNTDTTALKLNCLWGPHINKIQGEWYIYFCAQQNEDKEFTSQRMWVLKSTTDSPYGPYKNEGEVLNSDNTEWAIDGSVLKRQNGELYFVWSGISKEDINNKTLHQKSYIARMLTPTRIDRSTITLISSPTLPWECSVRPIQEGQRPMYVDKNGKTIIMYSANASWTDEYCLGSLTNIDGDFLNPSSWKKSETPLFQKTANVFGPGGASYVTSVDGHENWIIYHAAQQKGSGWARNIRMQKFTFDENNAPVFGKPIDAGVKIPIPSGE